MEKWNGGNIPIRVKPLTFFNHAKYGDELIAESCQTQVIIQFIQEVQHEI